MFRPMRRMERRRAMMVVGTAAVVGHHSAERQEAAMQQQEAAAPPAAEQPAPLQPVQAPAPAAAGRVGYHGAIGGALATAQRGCVV